MDNNTYVFGALFIAFVMYITLRGDLNGYLKVVGLA